jgi:hypothetical protein
MNKTRSRRANLLRFLMLLPLLAVILISFRDQIGESLSSPPVYTDTIPEVRKPNNKGYIINIRDNKGQCMVEVKDRNGKLVEKMPLTQWQAEEDQLEGKYGEIPPPPPPQPPSPPQPVNPPHPVNPEQPVQPAQPPAPPAPVKKTNELITSAEEFEISDKKATIRLKNGTVEEYDLRDMKERKEFESKWGQIIETNALSPTAIVGLPGDQTVVSPIAPSVAGNDIIAIDPNGAIIGGEEELIITISKYSNKQQLEGYRKEAKAKGVELNYDEIEYNEKGILVKLSGTMKSGTGKSNFVAVDFQKLVLAMTRVNGKTWFKVNTSNQKEVSAAFPATPPNKINQSRQVTPTKPVTNPLFLTIPLFPVEKDKC